MASEEATKEETKAEGTETAKDSGTASAPAKRGPGAKEVPQMQWKLVGVSAGTPVVLLKCVEREDAEAQMTRLEAEQYYDELKIYEIDAKVKLSSTQAKERQKLLDQVFAEKAAPKKAKATKKSAEPSQPTVIVAKAKPQRGGKKAAEEEAEKATTKAKKKTTAKAKKAKSTAKAKTTKTAKTVKAKAAKKTSTTKKAKAKTAAKKAKATKTAKKKTAKKKTAKKTTKKK